MQGGPVIVTFYIKIGFDLDSKYMTTNKQLGNWPILYLWATTGFVLLDAQIFGNRKDKHFYFFVFLYNFDHCQKLFWR